MQRIFLFKVNILEILSDFQVTFSTSISLGDTKSRIYTYVGDCKSVMFI